MRFYDDAHLAVMAARAGCPVSRHSAMGQALERLHIDQCIARTEESEQPTKPDDEEDED